MRWRQLGLALATVSALGLANADAASASNPPIRTMGGDIFVKFIGYSALLRSELWFFGNTHPNGDQTPFTGSSTYNGYYLFTNLDPQASFAPGKLNTLPPGSPIVSIGTVPFGGPYAQNTELTFALYVENLYKPGYVNPYALADGTQTRGAWFYTGLADQNPDKRIHTVVTEISPYHYIVGFEDSCKDESGIYEGLDCTDTRLTADWDFNDFVIEIYSTPEPLSLSLIGVGLLGLAAYSRRRRGHEVAA